MAILAVSSMLPSAANAEGIILGAAKMLGGSVVMVGALGVGVIGGGYYGATKCGIWTQNYYKRKGDPNGSGSLIIGISILYGGFGGALVGGMLATALSIKALGLV